MKIINEARIEFMSLGQNEAFSRAVVANFANQIDMTVEDLADIKTSVSEAVTNAIVHGYRGTIGCIELFCRIYKSKKEYILEIIVKDNGKGIKDIEKAREALWTSAKEEERSGMGFTVMETFMDTVAVSSSLSRGTTVTLRKKFDITEE